MSVFAVAIASAAECKPVDKNEKALAGAAKTSHMEVVPGLRRLAISGNFPNPTVAPELQAVQAAAHALSLDIISSEFRRAEEIAPAIEKVTGRVEALYVCADPLVHTNAVRLNALALAARLPVM